MAAIRAKNLRRRMKLLLADGTRVTVTDCYPVAGSNGQVIWLELSNGAAGAVDADDQFDR
jgi:hypothetical protein